MKALTNKQMAALIQEQNHGISMKIDKDFTFYDTVLKKERKDILNLVCFFMTGNVCRVALKVGKTGWMNYKKLTLTDRRKVEKLIREIQ